MASEPGIEFIAADAELKSRVAKERGAYQIRAWSSLDKTEAIPMWKAFGFGLCPATTYPKDQEVKGCFVTKLLYDEPE